MLYSAIAMADKHYLSTLFNKVENISDVQVKYNQDKRALYGRWQKPGDIAKFKRIDDTTVTNMSSRFIADDNTLELSTLSVGYETTTGKWLHPSVLLHSMCASMVITSSAYLPSKKNVVSIIRSPEKYQPL